METNTKLSTPIEILYNAYDLKQPISKESVPKNISKTDAYEIQRKVTDKKAKLNKDKLIGYKISLTSEETQELFHSTTPLYGALTQTSLSNGTIKLESMLSPLLEAELMFIANEDLSTQDNAESILQKMRIAPGLEIPDSRFTDWFPNLSFGQVIADSAVAGSVVIGEFVQGLSFEQLGNIHGTLQLDDEIIAEGSSTEVLGNPVHAIEWLIEELAKTGQAIRKGMVISSGTFILPKVLKEGTYHVHYENVGEVSLQVV
ncbi:hydratase [Virgibacillus phasianinus]|uniref:Hydratase n=1 Tax=Virgibacillus phasianinus TaxID=2017483 RepID=A0A220U6H2_9BACI|nr:hydratase [Virgibacillus phasianinus]ASK63748.1 hydratase [Virgibacillus phasianinus]